MHVENINHQIIMEIKKIMIAALLLLCSLSMMAQVESDRKDFVKGADVGFLAGQERRGVKFHDKNGNERECMELLKLLGMPFAQA